MTRPVVQDDLAAEGRGEHPAEPKPQVGGPGFVPRRGLVERGREASAHRTSSDGNTYLPDWFDEVRAGNLDSYRRNGSIIMLHPQWVELARWNLVNG